MKITTNIAYCNKPVSLGKLTFDLNNIPVNTNYFSVEMAENGTLIIYPGLDLLIKRIRQWS